MYANDTQNLKIDTIPILVTGSHRSGSTWIGQVMSHSINLHYIHEPFNPNRQSPYIDPGLFKYWFTEINSDNQKMYVAAFNKLFNHNTFATIIAGLPEVCGKNF